MTTYGVTETGFVIKPLDVILQEIAQAQRDAISPSIDTTTESPVGQLNGTFSSVARELWEVLEAAYAASSPITAANFALDQLVARAGLSRNAASYSTVVVSMNLDAAVTVPSGSKMSVDGNASAVFATTTSVTNATGVTATFAVLAQAVEAGVVRANAGTLTEIIDSVSGWNTVTNIEDASLGQVKESDAALRARFLVSAAGKGIGTLSAIRNATTNVDLVIDALVFENASDYTVDNQPPHSIETVVYDNSLASDTEIAQAIWDSKGGGVATYGSASGTATDDHGDPRTVNFSRVTVVNVYLEIDIRVDRAYPASGDDGLKEDVAEWGDSHLEIGSDVIVSALSQPVFDFGGVADVLAVRVGRSASPTNTANLPMSHREIADLDTGRIVINRV